MTTRQRSCIICGSEGRLAYPARIDDSRIGEFTYASRKMPELMHYEYRECETCQLLFVSELPERDALLDAYEGASFDAATESEYAAKAYMHALRRQFRDGVRSVLDVGCGDGEFLRLCRDSGVRDIYGIEPSPAASEVARGEIGKFIHVGGYEDHEPGRKFQMASLFQTIEHIDDPIGFFSATKRLVEPNGFVAVACHDYQAPVNRLAKEKSPIFDIEHLQLFSRKSIGLAMAKAGLEVISVKRYPNTYPMSYWARLAPIPEKVKTSGFILGSWFGKLPIRLPIGNIMAIARVVPDASA